MTTLDKQHLEKILKSVTTLDKKHLEKLKNPEEYNHLWQPWTNTTWKS